ncbi:hypothetical protein GCM10023185_31090 [Hymenobacter saemangeumensis]|uniref:Uncharacterized protein n=1 Tax=Hymenobacter saemangeumensis TaxID=1084522 RepID=A0ABP8IMI4_9BACT
MPITLPLHDPFIDGSAPEYEPGTCSLTQKILEAVMEKDFPTVAALGIEVYAERLMRVEYTHGAQAWYLDWNPPLPGYCVVFMEPWGSAVGPDGEMQTTMKYKTGLQAAARAEEVRRWIAPEV